MINSLEEYRDSLRPLKPRVFVDGRRIDNVADEPTLLPGINAIGVTYDMAADPALAPLMLAVEEETGRTVHRMTQIDRTPDDLLRKLEAVRLMCRESGCAQRYLVHDAFNGLYQATKRCDAELSTKYFERFRAFMIEAQASGENYAIAMTDAKGERQKSHTSKPTPTPMCTSSKNVPTASSFPASKPSSPRRPMCTGSW